MSKPKTRPLTEKDVRRIVADFMMYCRPGGGPSVDLGGELYKLSSLRLNDLPPGTAFRYVHGSFDRVYVKLSDGRTMCQQTGAVYCSRNSEVVCVCL